MNIRLTVFFTLIFLAGTAAGFFVSSYLRESSEGGSKQIRQLGTYKYINPLLECEVADGIIDARKENFQSELEDFVTELKDEHALTEAAVYFRDLNNGPAFGAGGDGKFFPASLLKVPVMMTYYHLIEKNPAIASTRVRYAEKRDFGIMPTILPKEELVLGQEYSVEELIRRMVVYSDNQALYLLSSHLPTVEISDLFKMLGVSDEVLYDTDAKLTVKEYAGFFRILFNSSYLSRESSEKALSLLASTEYDDGLVDGVPDDVVVAHKFGEAGTGDVERQLHDCGIVYLPDHPYLACIMTRGRNTETLKDSIAKVSRFIYERVDEQY